jgi:hypothetical protein
MKLIVLCFDLFGRLARSKPTKMYEFPDGYGAQFGEERFRLTESIFNPEAFLDKVSRRRVRYPSR